MKALYFLLFLATLQAQLSCNNAGKNDAPAKDAAGSKAPVPVLNQSFNVDPKALTKDFTTWYKYTYYNIQLSQNFIGLDIDSSNISKAAFLQKLAAQNVVALKTKIVSGQPVYRLFQPTTADENIKTAASQMAIRELAHFNMEGTPMPAFNFTDLNGRVYSNASAKGKLLLLKCWFIHCTACVKEFPRLNKLVDDNKDRKDILFVSLAMDTKEELAKFLETKEFKYATVPGMKDFMLSRLNITEFPTHLLIDRNGKIVKVVNSIEELVPFLQNEPAKTLLK